LGRQGTLGGRVRRLHGLETIAWADKLEEWLRAFGSCLLQLVAYELSL
jgi:hypothetical protein